MQDAAIATQTFSFLCVRVLLLLQDTVFSSVVTALFLRPIFKVLAEVGNVQRGARSVGRGEGQITLEKIKWLALSGTILAVVSSTALHIKVGLHLVLGGHGKPFYANPCSNVVVFGVNLGSVLNDAGMILACGVLKEIQITWESV